MSLTNLWNQEIFFWTRNILYINLQLRSRAVPAQEAPNLASLLDCFLSNIFQVLAAASLSLLISSLSDIHHQTPSDTTMHHTDITGRQWRGREGTSYQLAVCQTVPLSDCPTVYIQHWDISTSNTNQHKTQTYHKSITLSPDPESTVQCCS